MKRTTVAVLVVVETTPKPARCAGVKPRPIRKCLGLSFALPALRFGGAR